MSKTAPSRADPVVVFPLGRWCPPQETSQPHPPQDELRNIPLTSIWCMTSLYISMAIWKTLWSELLYMMALVNINIMSRWNSAVVRIDPFSIPFLMVDRSMGLEKINQVNHLEKWIYISIPSIWFLNTEIRHKRDRTKYYLKYLIWGSARAFDNKYQFFLKGFQVFCHMQNTWNSLKTWKFSCLWNIQRLLKIIYCITDLCKWCYQKPRLN